MNVVPVARIDVGKRFSEKAILSPYNQVKLKISKKTLDYGCVSCYTIVRRKAKNYSESRGFCLIKQGFLLVWEHLPAKNGACVSKSKKYGAIAKW